MCFNEAFNHKSDKMTYSSTIKRLGVMKGVARIGMLWILLLQLRRDWLACSFFVPPHHHARIQQHTSHDSCSHVPANMVSPKKTSRHITSETKQCIRFQQSRATPKQTRTSNDARSKRAIPHETKTHSRLLQS